MRQLSSAGAGSIRPAGIAAVALMAVLATASPIPGSEYDRLRSAALARCESLDPAAYQSGLYFNPDGYRSYFTRSECLQRVATDFRDEPLCAQVRERRSLLSSSWGYSAANCRSLVRQRIAADERALTEKRAGHRQGGVRLQGFRIVRNGNRRDFDILPAFAGEVAGSYALRFEILVGPAPSRAVLLHASGYHLDAGSRLSISVRSEDVRRALPQFAPDQFYTVRATMTLDVGTGGPAGRWSEDFVERVFPAQERTQTLDQEVRS